MAATLSNRTTARKDGVRVDKGIEPGDNHMQVHYRITNTRDDDAAIRIEESLAAAFPIDALDLDAEAGGGDWLLDGAHGRVALVDIIGAGETVTTGYVVRCDDPNAVECVIDAPEVDMVDPVGGDGRPTESTNERRPDPTSGSDDGGVDAAAVADAIDPGDVAAAMDAEAVVSSLDTADVVAELDAEAVVAELETDAIVAELDADAVVESLDAAAVADALDAQSIVDAVDGAAIAGALSDDVVLDALTGALADGSLEPARLETLREHLAPAFARSDDLRRQQLRARLEDFAAYADGLSELIDEHGTATEIIDDLRDDIDATAAGLAAVEDAMDDASDGHESVAARLDAVDDRLHTLSGRLDTVTERVDTVDMHLERADERHERLDGRVGTVDGRVDTVIDDLQVTRTNLQTLERTCETSMTELADTLATVQADITDIDRWRAQVGEAFTLTRHTDGGQESIFRPDDEEAGTDADATDDEEAGTDADATDDEEAGTDAE